MRTPAVPHEHTSITISHDLFVRLENYRIKKVGKKTYAMSRSTVIGNALAAYLDSAENAKPD